MTTEQPDNIDAQIVAAENEGRWGEAMRLKFERMNQSRTKPAERPAEEREKIAEAEAEGNLMEAMTLKLAGGQPSEAQEVADLLEEVAPADQEAADARKAPDEQIAEAEEAGDWGRAMALKVDRMAGD